MEKEIEQKANEGFYGIGVLVPQPQLVTHPDETGIPQAQEVLVPRSTGGGGSGS